MRRRDIFDKPVFKLEMVLCLAWARLLISVLPFRRLRPMLGPIFEEPAAGQAPGLTAPQLKKAADTGRILHRVAGRMPFRADCVPQALTARWMLARRGIATRIRIGTRRDPAQDGLQFHAWLMAGDLVVTGGQDIETYSAFGNGEQAAE
ncbi:MAG: lasso peptide biosynthesis B2 protein [Erythrobacter sp.]|nr:lasso peptide biosynthesis B2 protein [Erythrobacter sp.]